MKYASLRVSLVIPAYNEESYLQRCLEAVAAQTVKPFEVIVVDNNSTDATAAIARRYPFVTLLREPRQGVVFARDCGFNAASGDIIGRIDADSLIPLDWIERVQQIFAQDSALDAFSGGIVYRHVGCASGFYAIDRHIRHYLTKHMGPIGEQFLYGVNMAIRRASWHAVRNNVCHGSRVHEDLDLANHLSLQHARVKFVPELLVSIEWRQAAAGPRQFYRYLWSCPRVYARHGMRSTRYANRVALFVSLLYVPVHIAYTGFDPRLGRFSWSYFFKNASVVRPSPVSELT